MLQPFFETSQSEEKQFHYFARKHDIHPFLIRHLFSKGFRNELEMENFLFCNVQDFHSPFLLHDMKKAILRIHQSIANGELIYIFGDYDVDGMTATSILVKTIRKLGGKVKYYLPSRTDGYGLSQASLTKITKDHPSLIVTVDNGSSSHDAISYATTLGIDVIVTDHHEILQGNPPCFAFIHPKRSDSIYPCRDLCGAGVAFKLAEALYSLSPFSWEQQRWELLELAAIGTIADMMPLHGENRTIVHFGLKKLQQQPSSFFSTLFDVIRLPKQHICSTSVGFQIAPILNSCGRIDDANLVVRGICDYSDASFMKRLLTINTKRKQMTQEQFLLAEQDVLSQLHEKQGILISLNNYHEGLLGLISSKLSNTFHLPSIVINYDGKASARSGPNPDTSIIDILQKGSHFLQRYGGHKGAAGFGMSLSNFEGFRQCIQDVTKTKNIFIPKLQYHAKLPIDFFTESFHKELSLLEPFGISNPKPIFFSPHTPIRSISTFGKQQEFTKFLLGTSEVLSFHNNHTNDFSQVTHVDFLYTHNFHSHQTFHTTHYTPSSLP